MIIKTDRCNGCYNCVIACKDEYVGNDFLPFSVAQPDSGHFWMNMVERQRGRFPRAVKVHHTPTPCMGCKDAPCVVAAKHAGLEEAVYRRAEDGIVIIDPVKAKGHKEIVDSCPYGVIYWNEGKNVAQKCTYCAHLLESKMLPRCVESCPTDALVFGDVDNPESEVSKLVASGMTEKLRPELGIDTATQYTALPKTLVSGSVVLGDTDDCGSNASITITGGSESTTVKSDNFGDFEIDGLTTGKSYTLKVERSGYSSTTVEVKLENDTYLGDVTLKK